MAGALLSGSSRGPISSISTSTGTPMRNTARHDHHWMASADRLGPDAAPTALADAQVATTRPR